MVRDRQYLGDKGFLGCFLSWLQRYVFVKTHETVQLGFVYFSVCMLYKNINIGKGEKSEFEYFLWYTYEVVIKCIRFQLDIMYLFTDVHTIT